MEIRRPMVGTNRGEIGGLPMKSFQVALNMEVEIIRRDP